LVQLRIAPQNPKTPQLKLIIKPINSMSVSIDAKKITP